MTPVNCHCLLSWHLLLIKKSMTRSICSVFKSFPEIELFILSFVVRTTNNRLYTFLPTVLLIWCVSIKRTISHCLGNFFEKELEPTQIHNRNLEIKSVSVNTYYQAGQDTYISKRVDGERKLLTTSLCFITVSSLFPPLL